MSTLLLLFVVLRFQSGEVECGCAPSFDMTSSITAMWKRSKGGIDVILRILLSISIFRETFQSYSTFIPRSIPNVHSYSPVDAK